MDYQEYAKQRAEAAQFRDWLGDLPNLVGQPEAEPGCDNTQGIPLELVKVGPGGKWEAKLEGDWVIEQVTAKVTQKEDAHFFALTLRDLDRNIKAKWTAWLHWDLMTGGTGGYEGYKDAWYRIKRDEMGRAHDLLRSLVTDHFGVVEVDDLNQAQDLSEALDQIAAATRDLQGKTLSGGVKVKVRAGDDKVFQPDVVIWVNGPSTRETPF